MILGENRTSRPVSVATRAGQAHCFEIGPLFEARENYDRLVVRHDWPEIDAELVQVPGNAGAIVGGVVGDAVRDEDVPF